MNSLDHEDLENFFLLNGSTDVWFNLVDPVRDQKNLLFRLFFFFDVLKALQLCDRQTDTFIELLQNVSAASQRHREAEMWRLVWPS